MCDACVCVCVCWLWLACRISVSTRAQMQSPSTTNQQRTQSSILRSSSTWRTPCHQKQVLILPNGLSKLGERAHDSNLISTVGGILTHNLLISIRRILHEARKHSFVCFKSYYMHNYIYNYRYFSQQLDSLSVRSKFARLGESYFV